jgi:Fic family protein
LVSIVHAGGFVDPTIAYRWRPIEDLPADFKQLANAELAALASVWREQHGQLKNAESLRIFNERLQREWAIETGVIENVFTLDRGVTQLLIERGIDASLIPNSATNKDPELVAAIIRDHQDAMEGLFDFIQRRRPVSTSYIKELHALMTRNQETSSAIDALGRQAEVPLLHGEYKLLPNNPVRPDGRIHEYCPPEQVASEMDQLIAFCREHEPEEVPPEVEAAWFHHRFTQIHPFQDGNGRVVRALASLIFLREGWFPLLVTRNDRTRYLDALEAADEGDLGPLVDLFSSLQKRAFINALSITSDILQRERVVDVIAATRELLERRNEELLAELEKAKQLAGELHDEAYNRFQQVAEQLKAELGPLLIGSAFFVDYAEAGDERDYYFRREIIQSANTLGYWANPSVYAAWVRLVLRTDAQADILLSFHGIGEEYRGILAGSLTFFRRTQTDWGREVSDVTTICSEVFQINYQEDPATVSTRFERWLEEGLARALEIWRAGL